MRQKERDAWTHRQHKNRACSPAVQIYCIHTHKTHTHTAQKGACSMLPSAVTAQTERSERVTEEERMRRDTEGEKER